MKIRLLDFRTCIFFLCIMPVCALLAAENGGYGASFLRWGAGARAIAMGKAYTALADQGNPLFWNPAGLSQSSASAVAFMHSVLTADRTLDVAEASIPLPFVTLGIGWQGFGVDDIQARDNTGQVVGQFDNTESLYALGIGRDLLSGGVFTVRAGVAGKYFRQALYNYSADGWGADAGVLLTLTLPGPIKQARIGAAIQNLGAELTWNTDSRYSAEIPVTIRGGGALRLRFLPVTASADLEKTGDLPIRTHLGLEYTWMILALRAGLDEDRYAAGMGVNLHLASVGVRVNYAVTPDAISDQMLHFITIGLTF